MAQLFYAFLKDEDDVEKVFWEFLVRSRSRNECVQSEDPDDLRVNAHNRTS
jgi:hypothetical protein